jgi:hypothetical protein
MHAALYQPALALTHLHHRRPCPSDRHPPDIKKVLMTDAFVKPGNDESGFVHLGISPHDDRSGHRMGRGVHA